MRAVHAISFLLCLLALTETAQGLCACFVDRTPITEVVDGNWTDHIIGYGTAGECYRIDPNDNRTHVSDTQITYGKMLYFDNTTTGFRLGVNLKGTPNDCHTTMCVCITKYVPRPFTEGIDGHFVHDHKGQQFVKGDCARTSGFGKIVKQDGIEYNTIEVVVAKSHYYIKANKLVPAPRAKCSDQGPLMANFHVGELCICYNKTVNVYDFPIDTAVVLNTIGKEGRHSCVETDGQINTSINGNKPNTDFIAVINPRTGKIYGWVKTKEIYLRNCDGKNL